ncbi:MAG: hypothetical protein ALECFALPRED_010309 [Alectoria fallacina]|uniref:Dolichol-phosphate mannosyltransferase subunit 3 n=1 Tax=Alectoria fallacina TaxID=1903189 RepID=A0A8H3IEM4_9LECA|nr:MAG: hypothetical protein ALECFALPRED_010309 [Alectoria fallacina]
MLAVLNQLLEDSQLCQLIHRDLSFCILTVRQDVVPAAESFRSGTLGLAVGLFRKVSSSFQILVFTTVITIANLFIQVYLVFTPKAAAPLVMTRAQQTISLALLASSLYLACFLHIIPLTEIVQDEVIPVFPFWALVSFGSYLLFKLGWGVFTFNDVPEAHKELMGEIDMARVELKRNGIDVD